MSIFHGRPPFSSGGSTKQFNYDPLMRLTGISVKDPAANPVMDYSYTYDRMDNITDKATGHGNYAYGYDDLYRLSTVDNPSLADEAYTYDNVGNRLTSAETAGAWGYTANNELTGYDDVSYEYDVNGNMVSKTAGSVVMNYVYNIENRLVRVEDGSSNVIAQYYYDPFGRRLWKEAAGIRTYFSYADEGLVAEFDASGNQIKSYGYRPGSTWTTDPLFMEQGGQYYFYHNDHLGTPQQMTSVSGAVVWAAQYGAFGQAHVDAGSSVVNNLRFPGQYYDGETGLHYNFHRYYEPELGRYLRVDPIGFESGDLSLYVYANASPQIFIDPMGLYGRDMHYDYTYGLAKGLGYSKCAYEKIAEANNDVDVKYDPVQIGEAAVKIREQWHFPSQDRVDELLNNAFNSCDLVALGQALHVLQDSYSHADYSAKRGHWRFKPDIIKEYPAKAQIVAKETMEVLKTFESKCWDASRDKCCDN